MLIQVLSMLLIIFGIAGTVTLATSAGVVLWHYHDARRWDFRWRWRNWRLTQLSAVACLFFLAMTASYGVLGEVWVWVYLILAVQTGSWWLVRAITQRS